MKLILASNSPRRKELLSKLNYPFEVVPSTVIEQSTATLPVDIAKELAMQKAVDVYKNYSQDVVLGCDTVVDCNGQLLGKPKDYAQATQMLTMLAGKTHFVHTGVCIVCPKGVWIFSETTQVEFFPITQQQIANYVATGSPLDKAGSYGIQDSGFVKNIVGSYDNVVGFPTEQVELVLNQIYKG